MRKNLIASGAVAGALLLGSAGAALVLPNIAAAAGPTAAPPASPSASGEPSGDRGWRGGRGFGGGPSEAVSDASVAAKAIGISESDLTTALAGGQTIAGVAKAHGVDVQTVIDALVADKKDEVAAALKAGTITQARTDQELANATHFVTAQVNGTSFGPGGRGGPDGASCGHGHGRVGGQGGGNGTPSSGPAASPSTGTGTSG